MKSKFDEILATLKSCAATGGVVHITAAKHLIHEAYHAGYDAASEANAEAYREAKSLATFLYSKHYKGEAPQFELCNSTAGILTQIDNMVCGLVKPEEGKADPSTLTTEQAHYIRASLASAMGINDYVLYGECIDSVLNEMVNNGK